MSNSPKSAMSSRDGKHRCDFIGCNKTFGRVYEMERHKNAVHLQNSSRVCPAPDCNRRINRQDGIIPHMGNQHDYGREDSAAERESLDDTPSAPPAAFDQSLSRSATAPPSSQHVPTPRAIEGITRPAWDGASRGDTICRPPPPSQFILPSQNEQTESPNRARTTPSQPATARSSDVGETLPAVQEEEARRTPGLSDDVQQSLAGSPSGNKAPDAFVG